MSSTKFEQDASRTPENAETAIRNPAFIGMLLELHQLYLLDLYAIPPHTRTQSTMGL